MTTTDSGSNYVKAFSVFGTNAEQPGETTEDEDIVVLEDVSEDLTRAAGSLEYHLPPHHRCAAHSLNLISTVDAEQAEKHPTYKRLSRSTFAKCQALWNKSSRSTQATGIIEEECGLVLLKPNDTRWNSIFMAVERLNCIIKEKGENAIHKLSTELNLPKFKQAKIQFLKDYTHVTKPVAQALNILQGESNQSNASMGYLAPTITLLKKKLLQRKSSTQGMKPLVDALLAGIEKRFNLILNDEIIAAAILHPKFKDQWSHDTDILKKGINLINAKLANIVGGSKDSTTNEDDDNDNEFFKSKKRSSASELELFLDSPSDELASYSRFPQLREVFIELNTPLPASAACERLLAVPD